MAAFILCMHSLGSAKTIKNKNRDYTSFLFIF